MSPESVPSRATGADFVAAVELREGFLKDHAPERR